MRSGRTVFVRAGDTGAYPEIAYGKTEARRGALSHRCRTIDRAIPGFSYYAGFRSTDTGMIDLSPGGWCRCATAKPPPGRSIEVALGSHEFGNGVSPSASWTLPGAREPRRWASSRDETSRRSAARHSTSITDGSVVVLDEANRRLLRWRDGEPTEAVPVAINGTLADMTLDEEGKGTCSRRRRARANPLLRIFSRDGAKGRERRDRTAVPGSRRPEGPLVLQSSSAQWMPAPRE